MPHHRPRGADGAHGYPTDAYRALDTTARQQCLVDGKLRATTRPRPQRGGCIMAEGPWFFCLKHHTVETRDGCAERHRLGPYATREEAEHAVASVAEREEKLTSEDRAWEGD
jgi:hypothetical protein